MMIIRSGNHVKTARRKSCKILILLCSRTCVGILSALVLPVCGMAYEDTLFVTYSSVLVSKQEIEDTSDPSRYPRFSKQIKEDAAAFIASDGSIRGPYLESAILEVRTSATQNLSDREIAIFILGAT